MGRVLRHLQALHPRKDPSGLSTIDLSNSEAEAQLVAAFIKNPEAYWDLNDTGITSKDFLGNENRRVMKAIEAVVAGKKTPDLPNVIEALKAADNESSIAYATRLLSIPVSIAQAKEYSQTVKGLSVARDLAKAGSEIVSIATEERSDAQSALCMAESVLR
jgi:replicative DNA helicase